MAEKLRYLSSFNHRRHNRPHNQDREKSMSAVMSKASIFTEQLGVSSQRSHVRIHYGSATANCFKVKVTDLTALYFKWQAQILLVFLWAQLVHADSAQMFAASSWDYGTLGQLEEGASALKEHVGLELDVRKQRSPCAFSGTACSWRFAWQKRRRKILASFGLCVFQASAGWTFADESWVWVSVSSWPLFQNSQYNIFCVFVFACLVKAPLDWCTSEVLAKF